MAKSKSDFDPDLGGLFDDYDSAVLEASFSGNPNLEYVAKAGEGLGIVLTMDSGGDKPIQQFYSIGGKDQWQVLNNGREVVRVKNPDKHAFHAKSRASGLVEAMIMAVGKGNRDAGVEFFLKRDRFMTQADFYMGMNFHWKQQEWKYTNPETKEEVKTTGLFPDAYLGEATVETSSKAPTAQVASNLDAIVVELASGKNVRELKQAVVRDERFKGQDAYVRELVNGPKIEQMEKAGQLTMGPDKRYI